MPKLYQYYVKDRLVNGKPELYAYTIDKQYAKRFEKERSKDAFITHHVKVLDFDIPEFRTYEWKHRMQRLQEIPLVCLYEQKVKSVTLMGTGAEESRLEDSANQICGDVRLALDQLKNLSLQGYVEKEFIEMLCEYIGVAYIADNEGVTTIAEVFQVDTFHLFIFLHRDTFFNCNLELSG